MDRIYIYISESYRPINLLFFNQEILRVIGRVQPAQDDGLWFIIHFISLGTERELIGNAYDIHVYSVKSELQVSIFVTQSLFLLSNEK
jgi:hypothetical protein